VAIPGDGRFLSLSVNREWLNNNGIYNDCILGEYDISPCTG